MYMMSIAETNICGIQMHFLASSYLFSVCACAEHVIFMEIKWR